MRTMINRGATVFDTAPSYGASEQVAGDIANGLGVANRMFWSTKFNVAGRGGGGGSRGGARTDRPLPAGSINRRSTSYR